MKGSVMNYILYGNKFDAVVTIPGSAPADVVTCTIYLSDGSTFSTPTPTYIAGEAWKVTFTPTSNNETYIVVLNDATLGTDTSETYKATGVIGTVWDATSGAVGSPVGIANIALSKVGATRIVSFTENTENARLLNSIYGTIRDEVLRAHPWNFAVTRAVPSLCWSMPDEWVSGKAYIVGDMVMYVNHPYECQVAHTSTSWAADIANWASETTDWIPYEYSYSHTIPSDCLRVIDVTTGTTRIEDFKVEDGKILSHYDVIYIRYIYRTTDPTVFDSNFISCFATRLASEVCFPLTGKADLAMKLKEEYFEQIRLAKGIDGQESGIPDQSGKDVFLESRY